MGTLEGYVEDFNYQMNEANNIVQQFNNTNFNDMSEFRRAGDCYGQLIRCTNEMNKIANYVYQNLSQEIGAKMEQTYMPINDTASQMSTAYSQHPNWMKFAR
jgi:hypothetical protein